MGQEDMRVNRPPWYTQHPSGVECIEIAEHLPYNLGNALKYVWRAGLKPGETALRDLKSALWYVRREAARRKLFKLEEQVETGAVWRAFARKVCAKEGAPPGLLGRFLEGIIDSGDRFGWAEELLSREIKGRERE
jgi:hypothetical protein